MTQNNNNETNIEKKSIGTKFTADNFAKNTIPPEVTLTRYEEHVSEELVAKSLKEKIRIRQQQALIQHLKGLSNNEIANNLGVSLSTVEKDLHEVREDGMNWMKEFRANSKYNEFRESFEQLKQVIRELWQKHRDEKDTKLQLKILDSIADKIVKHAKIMDTR